MSAATALEDGDMPPALPGGETLARGRLQESGAWWRQNPKEVQVICELDPDVSIKSDVRVSIRKDYLSIRVAEAPIIEGPLLYDLVADRSDWLIEEELEGFGDGQRYLVVDIRKSEPGIDWVGITSSSCNFGKLPTESSALQLDSEALAKLDATDFVSIPNFVSPDILAAMRDDVADLHWMAEVKCGVRRCDLQDNGATPLRKNASAQVAAEFIASELAPFLRSRLAKVPSCKGYQRTAVPLIETVEMSYSDYSPGSGGFMRAHLDNWSLRPGSKHRRAFSFVIYLNDVDADSGGALRIFQPLPESVQHANLNGNIIDDTMILDTSRVAMEIQPAAGTLVVWRTEAIPHEVTPAFGTRQVLVGWLHRPSACSLLW